MKPLVYVSMAVLFYAQICYGQGQVYVVETYIVVDDKAVKTVTNEIPGTASVAAKRAEAVTTMRTDINYFLTEANKLLSTLTTFGVNIEIRVRDIKFLSADLFPANAIQSGGVITANTGLQIFSERMKTENVNFDAAILLTGYDIYGDTGPYTTGYARVGRVCDGENAVGMVEYNGTYQTAVVIAHELSHLLGASHDGIASKNIMAYSTSPLYNRRWSFSGCTGTDIKDFLPLLNPNCLLQTNASSYKPSTTYATYNGKLFKHDTVCQRTLNSSQSYTCLSGSLYNTTSVKGDVVCQSIYCRIPGTSYCSPAYTSDGMICDKNKRCDKGKCVPDTSAASASVDASCVLGNQKVLEFPSISFSGTCDELIVLRSKTICYNSDVQQLCCASCNRYKTNIPGCEYGDKSMECVRYTVASVCPQNKAVCCNHCRGFVQKRSTGEDKEFNVTLATDDLGREVEVDKPYTVTQTEVLKRARSD